MNGIVIKAKYFSDYSSHMRRVGGESPVDLATFFYFAGSKGKRSYKVMTFRSNLFSHIGGVATLALFLCRHFVEPLTRFPVVSTFADHGDRYTPICYQLLYDWLQPGETFDFEVGRQPAWYTC